MTDDETRRQSLRHLAAARFFLPMVLKGSSKFDVEEQYLDYLHNREYKLAMEEIAEIALENAGFAEECYFWRELALAADTLGLAGKAAEYRVRADG